MKRLVLVPVLCCSLVISGTAAADLTCKAAATWPKLAREALIRLRKEVRIRCVYGLRGAGCGQNASRTR